MSTPHETILSVKGMTCPTCVRHVDEALREVNGVAEVEVKLREGKVLVRHDPTSPVSSFVAALKDAGYESAPANA